MIGMCYRTFVQTHRVYNTKVNPKVNCGLQLIRMCQYRFSHGDKCISLVEDVDNGGSHLYVSQSILSQFCSEPKTALKT